MNRELLESPFDPGQIKQRDGNFGKVLDFFIKENKKKIKEIQADIKSLEEVKKKLNKK